MPTPNPQDGYSSAEAEFASIFNSNGGGGDIPIDSLRTDEDADSTSATLAQSDELDELVDDSTPEDSNVSDINTNDDEDDEDSDAVTKLANLSKEELAKLALKLRKENAKRRVTSNKEAEEKLEFQKWKDSQLTEKQRLEKRVHELEAEKAEADRERLIRKVARKAGLSAEVADRLRGNTEAELLEDAATLVKVMGKKSSTASMHAGTRGTPVGDDATGSDTDWFRDLFTNSQ